MLPTSPDELTIGIDIAGNASKTALNPTASGSSRAAIVLALAAIAIAVVVGLAWLISRAGEDDAPSGAADPTSAAGATAADSDSPSPTSSGPAVPRGIVPDVIGLPSEDAVARITAAGYESFEVLQKHATVPRGNVIDQGPFPGTQLSEGQVVSIIVSDGPE